MSDTRSRALLLVGLALAVVTGVLLYGVLTGVAERTGPGAAGGGVDVLVARSDLPAQTVITADHLERRSYPADLVPAGTVADPASLIGQQLTQAVPQGLPIVRTSVGAVSGRAIAGVTLERGRVLVAFPTTDALTTSGLIQAGDHVDILATMAAGAEPRATQKIVQDLTVVQVTGGTREQAARSLVFVVDHQTSLVLKHLRDAGAIIDIVVRARTETDAVRTQVVDNAYILATYGLRR
jgi:pilus assembly protein CpaB